MANQSGVATTFIASEYKITNSNVNEINDRFLVLFLAFLFDVMGASNRSAWIYFYWIFYELFASILYTHWTNNLAKIIGLARNDTLDFNDNIDINFIRLCQFSFNAGWNQFMCSKHYSIHNFQFFVYFVIENVDINALYWSIKMNVFKNVAEVV